ncbi:MAG: hypothetical protein AB7N76_06020 [Planctomycetota bacterium]
MSDAEPLPPSPARPEDLPAEERELPVVARMVVEIRSDGVRTAARGAIEDLQTGQRVAIQTDAMDAGELTRALASSLLTTTGLATGLAREALRSLVPSPLRRLRRRVLGRED